MPIEKIPDSYFTQQGHSCDLFVYDFKMTTEVVKSKVDLSMHMFSFLLEGRKQVHFDDDAVAVNKDQSLLIKRGNCLWTELIDKDNIYFCKLLFFSEERLVAFLKKYDKTSSIKTQPRSYFIIENDSFIMAYLKTLTSIKETMSVDDNGSMNQAILDLKFEELMLYLINKYGINFESFLFSLIAKEKSNFIKILENSIDSNLKLEEIAFLCNMSLSTFKRHFKKEYNTNPGKWLQQRRLLKAKQLLETGKYKASEIYFNFGYNNLSNFSIAFKNEFQINPTDI